MVEKRFKKISRSGAITIPSDIRREFGFNGGDGVSITQTENGGLLIEKSAEICFFCGGHEGCMMFFGRNICTVCQEAIANIFIENDNTEEVK